MKKHLAKVAILLVICMCLPLFAACDIGSIFGKQPIETGDAKDDGKTPEKNDDELQGGLGLELGKDGNSYVVVSYDGSVADVVIPASYNGFPVTAIGEKAFQNSKELISVEIPDSVEIIGESAFKNCQNLKFVTIGVYESRLYEIGKQAFQGCSMLNAVEFVGDADAWNSVEKGKDWDKNAGSKTDNKKYELVYVEPSEIPTEITTAAPNETTSKVPTEQPTESESVKLPSEGESTEIAETEKDDFIEAEGEHADIINLNNSMANGVQAYFTDAGRTHYNISNTEMTMSYSCLAENNKQVAYIANSRGNHYIENTMDVFVKMTDGSTYYASQSQERASVNLRRFGYYYYQGLFENQDFASIQNVNKMESIPLKNVSYMHGVSGKGTKFKITDTIDPYFIYQNLSIDTSDAQVITVTMKVTGDTSNFSLYYSVGDRTSFSSDSSTSFSVINDGEFHTYVIVMEGLYNYSGTLTSLRFDPNSSSVGDMLEFREICVGTYSGNVPTGIKISRQFNVYSNKMHHAVQFATTKTTNGIAELGMMTKIAANTVEKLIVKDRNGLHYTFDGVNWADVEYVAFDIKGVGIFGYILPDDDAAGKIRVTLEEGEYIIVQTVTPDRYVIKPSIGGKNDSGEYFHADGVTDNGNDIFLAQRIYTDNNHTFDEFVKEAEIEINPLSSSNFAIDEEDSDDASYVGYDPIRGIYVLNIASPSSYNVPFYKEPNKHYKVNFKVAAGHDFDRDIYIMTATQSCVLECAVVLDEDLMMLPIPMEVIKNFSEQGGERNLFNISDPTFSEAIFMIPMKAGEKYEYNILNLYQNWGKYPLKQISQLAFISPFYHLSTGVTETNTITPWFNTGAGSKTSLNTLPDCRAMSAPFMSESLPQHTNGGTHEWLRYTDADGNTYAVENVENTITSYGPTYAEVVMSNISDDGKIKVTYTHMEMPQTDENRTYYTMEYEILEDLHIRDFSSDFQFYSVSDNDHSGTYTKIGYLDQNNQHQVVEANNESGTVSKYILGNNCPYFSFFDMQGGYNDYVNVAFLIYNAEFAIDGQWCDPEFIILNSDNSIRLSLDLGEVTLKKGDKFTINAIVLPWGSQELGDGVIDTENGNYEYTMELADGTQYMDKNVRDVRENTLLNPAQAIAYRNCEIVESVFLPKVRTTNGKDATFTLSGGENNIAVKVSGFNKLTAPIIEELVEGQWVEYVLNSAENPDICGNGHYYDGYSVQYEKDGTYSYSFVVTMDNGTHRTFRVSAYENFTPWPDEVVIEREDHLQVYVDAYELYIDTSTGYNMCDDIQLNEENGLQYTSFYGTAGRYESYFNIYRPSTPVESGQYLVMKYRIPSDNSIKLGMIEFYTSTENRSATATDGVRFSPIADGEWHTAVLDLSRLVSTFTAADDGMYYAKYIRVDIFNQVLTADSGIDIAYIGIDGDLQRILEINRDMDTVDFFESKDIKEGVKIDTATGKPIYDSYIDPASGYTQSSVSYASMLDYVNKGTDTSATPQAYRSDSANGISVLSGYDTMDGGLFTLNGWCVANGGVNKYVWSCDGGKTWCNFTGTASNGNDAMINVASGRTGEEFDAEASKKNAAFQGTPITADLSNYAGSTVELIVAAVPEADTSSLIILYCFEDVNVIK